MSRLNASAFEFVPGKSFALPQQQQPPHPPPPPERPEQIEAPQPPPTISLDIGEPKPPPSAPPSSGSAPIHSSVHAGQTSAKITPQSSKPATPKPQTSIKAETAGASSKAFTTDKAKTDTSKVAQEVKDAADNAVLEDLYGNPKEHLNIIFIGHVDAGKSTMGGNILFLTGMVDKRTMEKYEKDAKDAGRESWYLSWALDSTPQERSKGKTVEVGRAYFETNTRRYTILDAPGHKTYVPSMISGAAQADVAVLVISARKGEFETGFEKGGQTREHIMLVRNAGVSKLVVAINKMDEPTVKWDKARYDEIKAKLEPFIKNTFGRGDLHFIPVSGYTGINLKDRIDKSSTGCSWWEGPSLLQHLDGMSMVDRKINAPLIMPISEKYKDMGTVVVGKIESGQIRKGDTIQLMPNKHTIDVVALYNEMEEEINRAVCGDNIRIRIRGVDDEDVSPGFVLTSPSEPVHAVRQFEAQLVILEHKNIICAGYSAVLHVHTLSEEVVLSTLLHYFDKATGRKSKKPPQFAKKGQKIVALIETTAPICIETFADHAQLGRFTLRDEGRTIAIGKVTKIYEAEGVANLHAA